MDENFNERINILRKRSRLLLAEADRSSKKVKKEIKKLRSQNVTLRESYENDIDDQNFCYKRHAESWNLRNDSSSVGAALCPDYFCDSSNHNPASMPNKSSKRVLISSKRHTNEQGCPKNIHRKPVKECYCNAEVKKLQLRSARTQHKPNVPCRRCKSHAYFNPPIAKDSSEKSLLNSPISCETLRRVQNIDYAPRSQFLRNVQSKVSLLHTAGDSSEVCPRCPCYHKLLARKTIPNVDYKHQSEADKESRINDPLTKSKSLSKVAKDVESTDRYQYSGSDSIDKSSKVSLKKQARPKLVSKRTLSSKKSVPDVKKTKSNSKVSAKSKRALQSVHRECACSHSNKADSPSKTTLDDEGDVDAEEYQRIVCVDTGLDEINKIDEEHLSHEEVKELKKFRDQNYFDTHGSSHALQSSKSSGSVEQYLLNDRLFPELARKTHKKDLVVTMPACATIQRKRIHYFPRYIVRQEKSNCNTSHKKKHCQSCPLTGHAIDLGIIKIRPPLNSLALKYQKRQP